MIVQRFAREVIPDSKAIVRQAIDEQAEIVEQRINYCPTRSMNLSGTMRHRLIGFA